MTATYFESTVKYEKVNEDGKAKKVTELYLIDAMSFFGNRRKELQAVIRNSSGGLPHSIPETVKNNRIH